MITSFKDEYFFLSNFSESPINIQGIVFPTVEHYFQAMKATCYEDFLKVANTATPSEAKKLGRKIDKREDWDDIKDQIMEYAVFKKFENDPLRSKLLATGDVELIEGNWWGDEYWGVSSKTNQGLNKLGKILMKVRSYLRQLLESQRQHPNYIPPSNPT